MRNKVVMIITIFAVMTAMIGIGSAEVILLNDANEQLLPDDYQVKVETSGDTMTIHLDQNSQTYPGRTIDGVSFMVPIANAVSSVKNGAGTEYWNNNDWKYPNNYENQNCDGFGSFYQKIGGPNSPNFGVGVNNNLVIKFNQNIALENNVQGNKVCVHLKLENNYNILGTNVGSTFISGLIPEFPTVALPIAAVIGMVFFFQNRKKKEE